MANLPTKTHLTGSTATEAQFQTAIGGLYDFVAQLVVGAPVESLVIASDKVTPTTTNVKIDTEAAIAADNLTNILATNLGQKTIYLRTTSSARVITIKHNQTGSGKIILADGADLVMDSTTFMIALSYDDATATWTEMWRNFGVHTPSASSKASAISNLGLGTSATKDFGTASGQVPLNSNLGALAYLNLADISSLVGATGDISASLASSKTGHVLMDGGTIGKTGSGATNRANNDTLNLYTLLWGLNSVSFPLFNGGLPQSRGATANADWTAGYTIGLPDARGRTLVGRDNMGGNIANRITSAGSGINGTILGAFGGLETVVLTSGQLAAHFHSATSMTTNTAGAHSHTFTQISGESGGGTNGLQIRGFTSGTANSTQIQTSGSHSHSISGNTDSAGANEAHQNTQPSIVVNYFIKL